MKRSMPAHVTLGITSKSELGAGLPSAQSVQPMSSSGGVVQPHSESPVSWIWMQAKVSASRVAAKSSASPHVVPSSSKVKISLSGVGDSDPSRQNGHSPATFAMAMARYTGAYKRSFMSCQRNEFLYLLRGYYSRARLTRAEMSTKESNLSIFALDQGRFARNVSTIRTDGEPNVCEPYRASPRRHRYRYETRISLRVYQYL